MIIANQLLTITQKILIILFLDIHTTLMSILIKSMKKKCLKDSNQATMF